jgi:hypothetical protein
MRHIKLFENFINEEKSVFEITSTAGMEKPEATKLIEDHYPENLTYRGIEFFDKIYMDILTKFAHEKLKIGSNYKYMEDDGEGGEYEETATVDGQESYLGYLPDKDVFIEGYDMFGDDPGDCTVFIKLGEDLKPTNVNKEFNFHSTRGMMYGNGGAFTELHSKFPTLIDIRLD